MYIGENSLFNPTPKPYACLFLFTNKSKTSALCRTINRHFKNIDIDTEFENILFLLEIHLVNIIKMRNFYYYYQCNQNVRPVNKVKHGNVI